MKAYYHGFVIEKDQTIDTELYYVRRMNGGKWAVNALETPVVSIESIQGSLNDVCNYINSIEDFYE